jgi:hypothetical protein
MPNDEQTIMQMMKDKGLTAPHVTPEQIDAQIVSDAYFTFPGTTLTVCALTLRNGFIVTGESACADPANFDAEIAHKIARQKAREKIWALEGYALRSRLTSPLLGPAWGEGAINPQVEGFHGVQDPVIIPTGEFFQEGENVANPAGPTQVSETGAGVAAPSVSEEDNRGTDEA